MFHWFGDRIQRFIDDRIDRQMHAMGEAVVARARQLAPVDTGALRESISYVVAYNEGGGRHTLSIQVGMPYGVFQEFGTRSIPPHPFIRPALNEVGRAWGFDVSMDFNAPVNHQGLLASTGRGARPGFAAHAGPGWRPLTPKQQQHVERVLKPSIRKHHRGNVKRARFQVG